MPGYRQLAAYDIEVKEICDSCLTHYKTYSMTMNNQKYKCIVNDNRNIVLISASGIPIRLPYKKIKRLEKRGWFSLVFVLSDKEILITGFRRNTMFNHIKTCFTNQLLVESD
jgi:hypothetical protein